MKPEIRKIIDRALREDLSDRDITTKILFDKDKTSACYIMTREKALICGVDIVKRIFRRLDPNIRVTCHYKDGDEVQRNTKIMSLKGQTRSLLTGERTALNFLSYLSGISTLTHNFVEKVKPYDAKIMDTRKTTPGLRALEKMAVRTGGGTNHRFNLNEMAMIKDNHRIAHEREATIEEAIRKVRRRTKKHICVEVDNLTEFRHALNAGPDIILLDNMTCAMMNKAVKIRQEYGVTCLLEASGGVTLSNVKQIARTGVDRISVGALTHSPGTVDYTLEFL
ncbi:MAG: carboxylating nicotinate-nucleotide diphosphorylase [Candidatus Omnitrophota bacterium]